EYDFLSRSEAPSEEVMASALIVGAASGGISHLRTSVAMTSKDAIDQGVDRSRPVPAGVGTAERPIAPADRNSAHGPFGGIIRQADAAVVEEAGEGRPSVQTVIDGLGDFA